MSGKLLDINKSALPHPATQAHPQPHLLKAPLPSSAQRRHRPLQRPVRRRLARHRGSHQHQPVAHQGRLVQLDGLVEEGLRGLEPLGPGRVPRHHSRSVGGLRTCRNTVQHRRPPCRPALSQPTVDACTPQSSYERNQARWRTHLAASASAPTKPP